MGISSDSVNRSDPLDIFPFILSRHQYPIKFLGDLKLTPSTYETEMKLPIKACKKEYRVVNIPITGHAISDRSMSTHIVINPAFKYTTMMHKQSLDV